MTSVETTPSTPWEHSDCRERYGARENGQRYEFEPEIVALAGFEPAAGVRVLEIGVRVGADALWWVRAGAVATGIHLAEGSVTVTRERLEDEGLKARVRVAVASLWEAQFDVVSSCALSTTLFDRLSP